MLSSICRAHLHSRIRSKPNAATSPLLWSVQQVQVQGYKGNYHYQRLATHMGAQYQLVVSVSRYQGVGVCNRTVL